MQDKVFAFDFHGVIIDRYGPSGSMWRSSEYLETPEVAGMVEYLDQLRDVACHLIVTCGKDDEVKIRKWFSTGDYHHKLGIEQENLHFTREITENATLCKQLQVTHFVSSRLEILGNLYGGSVKKLILFRFRPRAHDDETFEMFYNWTEQVTSWQQLSDMLRDAVPSKC